MYPESENPETTQAMQPLVSWALNNGDDMATVWATFPRRLMSKPAWS